MNKRQKIVLWLTIVIFIWIGFGGPYDYGVKFSGTRLGQDDEPSFAKPKPKIYYCFGRFTEILRAWIVLVVPSAAIIYSLRKTGHSTDVK
jgi:hypothetical protein